MYAVWWKKRSLNLLFLYHSPVFELVLKAEKRNQQSDTSKCVRLDQRDGRDRPHVVAALHDRANKIVRLSSLSSRRLCRYCSHCARCAVHVVRAHTAALLVCFVWTADGNLLPCSLWRTRVVGFFLFLWISDVRVHCPSDREWKKEVNRLR